MARDTMSVCTGIGSRELETLVENARVLADGGYVADYIPELSIAVRSKTAVCVCDVDGTRVEAGDTAGFSRDPRGGFVADRQEDNGFTIQSISKVFALLYVLETTEGGENTVFQFVGREPTGEEFNADPKRFGAIRRPANPMINIGAILITSLFPGSNREERFAGFLHFVRMLCDEESMPVDERVYRSERRFGHNNRSLAWKMTADGILRPRRADASPATETDGVEMSVSYTEDVLDNYFRQCSIVANCRHLARAASVIANGGVDPVSRIRRVEERNAASVLSLMSSCGLYNGSGEFAHNVGMPGKSGVGGGIMCAVPGKAGIATFSPALDPRGNSVRGLYMLKALSEKHALSIFSRDPMTIPLKEYSTDEALNRLAEEVKYSDAPDDLSPATYIPELRAASASKTGIALCLPDGTLHSGGDHTTPFSMQSISNAFALLYVLDRRSEGEVFRHVGKEPSGKPYHEYLPFTRSPSDPSPMNPMINAGAIVVGTMIPDKVEFPDANRPSELPIDDFIEFVRAMCGNPSIDVNRRVFESERKTGFRNRSLAWLLNDNAVFHEILERHEIQLNDAVVESILGVYFRLCSLEVTCDDLARFGAVLANDGRELKTNKRLVGSRFVRILIAMMSSTGLYDGSGEFAYRVGIPAKSGVSGGIMGVVPGRLGVGAYSPVIDKHGNSFRGQILFEKLSLAEQLSIFHTQLESPTLRNRP